MKYLLFVLMFAISISMQAQVPQKMSYQAVIRDANNNLLSLKVISMRISILKGVNESNAVYRETQTGKTNLNGLVSLQIGTGAVEFGNFSKIDWANGPFYVYTETDPDGGFDYRINGKSELLSVPFALYALNNNASFDSTSLHTRIVDLQAQAIENKKNIDINLDSIKDNAVEIHKNLDSIKANSAQIEDNVDSIKTKIDLLDLIAILSNYQRIGKILNAVTIDGDNNFDVKSNGNLQASKNISLSGNIESLGTSSSIGTLEKPFKDLYISAHSMYIESDMVGQNIPPTVLSNLNGNLEISSGGFKLMGANAAFIAPRFEGSLIGNANTATKFETPRTINGIAFDGSSNITIPSGAANGLTFNNTGTGAVSGVLFDGSVAKTISYNSIGAVASNSAITGATKTKLTYDAKGLVTAGADATTADIAESLNKNYVTDAQKAGVLSNTTGVNTGDNAVNSNYSSLISNATHTGDVTGTYNSAALTVVRINGTSLAALGTGILKNTTVTGVPSIAVAADFPTLNQSTTGNAATATRLATGSFINSVLFNGSSNINILAASPYSLTYTNSGRGDVPGESFNGSSNRTISHNSIGASPLAGSEALTTTGLLTTLTLSSNEYSPSDINPKERKNSIYRLQEGDYNLFDGFEGQVIYILPSGAANWDKINIIIKNGTKWDGGVIIIREISWIPFVAREENITMVSAIFSGGAWFINGGRTT